MSFDSFHLLDADIWNELADKKILDNGYVFVGRRLTGKYDVKIFIKETEKQWLETKIISINQIFY